MRRELPLRRRGTARGRGLFALRGRAAGVLGAEPHDRRRHRGLPLSLRRERSGERGDRGRRMPSRRTLSAGQARLRVLARSEGRRQLRRPRASCPVRRAQARRAGDPVDVGLADALQRPGAGTCARSPSVRRRGSRGVGDHGRTERGAPRGGIERRLLRVRRQRGAEERRSVQLRTRSSPRSSTTPTAVRVTNSKYGDVAGTTTAVHLRRTRHRLSTVYTGRSAPAIWSTPPAGYTPPSTPATTQQLVLENGTFSYDAASNPIEIQDLRTASEWPVGAKPVSRAIGYDDLYRVATVQYEYPGGNDSWTSPFEAEDTGAPAVEANARPAPHVDFDGRVLSKSRSPSTGRGTPSPPTTTRTASTTARSAR